MPPSSERQRLDSWKEIAAHLGRTVRTVQRWEREEGLPVHRHLHQKLPSVYAYRDEIDQWWEQGRARLGTPEAADLERHPSAASPRRRTRWRGVAALAAAALAVVLSVSAWRDAAGRSDEPTAVVATDTDADALYLEGRQHWNARTPRGFADARRAFEAAIRADPGHARAHAGLADTLSLLEAFGLLASDEALPQARAEAERALQLDPSLGEAHASLAFALWESRDQVGALAQMRRAIELDPDYPTARHWHALFLLQMERYDEAVAEATRARDLDPSRPIFWTDLAVVLTNAGRVDDAVAVLERARDRHPAFPGIYVHLADIARLQNREADAVRYLRSAVSLGDNRVRVIALLGCLEERTGNPAAATEALRLIRSLEASGTHVADDALTAILAVTGDADAAYAQIARAMAQRQEWIGGIVRDSCYARLHDDPRWPALREEIRHASWLPPYARKGL